jgi:predicted enzyme related to lactoylglutathione lyase
MNMTQTADAQKTAATVTSTVAEPSRFVWYELHTPDRAAAARFYEAVLKWTTQDSGDPNRKYSFVHVAETPIGGLLEKPAHTFASGEKARWVGYLGVDNAHLFSKRVQEAAGVVHRPPEEIPGVGIFAVVGDPQGAIFTLFQPLPGMTRPAQPEPCTPGMPTWHELAATHWESEFDFYAGLFGWTKAHAVEMGPNAVYQIFAVGSEPIGGMMTLPHAAQSAAWMFYFHVDNIEAAVDRVKQHGGTVLHGPAVVPGGQQVAQCLDTQGAAFGMFGPAKQ